MGQLRPWTFFQCRFLDKVMKREAESEDLKVYTDASCLSPVSRYKSLVCVEHPRMKGVGWGQLYVLSQSVSCAVPQDGPL